MHISYRNKNPSDTKKQPKSKKIKTLKTKTKNPCSVVLFFHISYRETCISQMLSKFNSKVKLVP